MITSNQNLMTMRDRFASMREQRRQVIESAHGYKVDRQNRFIHRRHVTEGSADFAVSNEYEYNFLVAVCQELDRNNMVVGQGVDTLTVQIIQQGFALDPKTGDQGADEYIKAKWDDWAGDKERVDVQRMTDFRGLSWLALRTAIVAGDMLALPLQSGQIQTVENYRLRTPNTHTRRLKVNGAVINGVHIDNQRRRLGYYLTRDQVRIDRAVDYTSTRFYRAYDSDGNQRVIHAYHPRRLTQTRGIPALVNVTDPATMLDGIHEAKLVQQQGVSNHMLVREREQGFEAVEGEDDEFLAADACRPGETRTLKQYAPGMEYTTYPGEKLKVLSANIPNPTYFDQTSQLIQFIGLNLGLPKILFMLDATETNFTGWRGAMDAAKLKFRHFQESWATIWNAPVFSWKMRQWSDPASPLFDPVLVAYANAGVDVFRHTWVYPAWPYVQPLQDAQADLLQQRNGLNSPRRIQRKHSREWDVVSTEIVQDNAMAIRKAKAAAAALNAEFPDDPNPVGWREMISLPTPEGVQINEAPDSQGAQPPQAQGPPSNEPE